jgi:uncharacterized protein (DUF433 family)
MRVSENQLVVLINLLQEVIDGTIQQTLEQAGEDGRARLVEFHERLLNQQNEIVDTSQYYEHTADEYLRLALDLFEGHEVLGQEKFLQSPLGQHAEKILFADVHAQRQGGLPCIPGTDHTINWLVHQLSRGSTLAELAEQHGFDLAVAKRVVQELRWPRKSKAE